MVKLHLGRRWYCCTFSLCNNINVLSTLSKQHFRYEWSRRCPLTHPGQDLSAEKPKTGSMWRGLLAWVFEKAKETALTPVPDFRKLGSRVGGWWGGGTKWIYLSCWDARLGRWHTSTKWHTSRRSVFDGWLGKGVIPDDTSKGKCFGVITLDYITTRLASWWGSGSFWEVPVWEIVSNPYFIGYQIQRKYFKKQNDQKEWWCLFWGHEKSDFC